MLLKQVGKYMAWAMVISLFLSACKKKDTATPPGVAIDLSKDTMFYTFKDEYLWTDVVPDYMTFNPRRFNTLPDLFNALVALKPLDRYSFLDDGSVAGQLQGGISGDFGFDIGYNAPNDLRVIYCYDGSRAYQQGIRRTWQVIAINGDPAISYDEGSYGDGSGKNLQRVSKAMYSSNSTAFTFKKPDGTTQDITVTRSDYSINPVLFSKAYNFNGHKIGYFVFNSFVDTSKIAVQINNAFNNFMAAGITDLVVDLRYNHGGVVATQEYLANLIAPLAVGTNNQTVMYKETFNTNLTNGLYSPYVRNRFLPPPDQQYTWGDVFADLTGNATVYFTKKGGLNLQNVVFIGTRSTASASELLYNSLKPHINAKWVGDTTYGKPVGFLGIPVGQYDMYAISFQSKNSLGEGDYFNGFPPNVLNYEDMSIDWGSTSEIYLKDALILLGVPAASLGRTTFNASLEQRRFMRKNALPGNGFNGMIETRKRHR
jgi:carboxyl-terminal processing protease